MKKRSESGRGFLLRYTLLFAAVSALIFLPFVLGGRSFVNKTDGMTQYLVYLRYMGQYLRNCFREIFRGSFSFPSYDFSIGLGDDIGQIVRFHPLDFLSAAVPSGYTEQLYAVILFLRLFLAGLSFSLFAFYWRSHTQSGEQPDTVRKCGSEGRSSFDYGIGNRPDRTRYKHRFIDEEQKKALWSVHPVNVLSGAIVYVFGGYMLLRVMNHPTYAAPFIVFPLLLTGAEKVMRREGYLLFPSMVFLGFWSNYYFMYIMSWGLLVYVLVRFPELYTTRRGRGLCILAGRMILLYLLGLAMSLATLLPTILRYRESIRTSAAYGGKELLFYSDVRRYFAWFLNLISPFQGSGNGVNLNFAVIVFPCLILLFLLPWKMHRSLKLFLIASLIVLLVPGLGYVLAVFNRENNRWMFLVALCLGMCVVFAADHFHNLSRRRCMILAAAVGIYLAASLVQILLTGFNPYNLTGAAELLAAVPVLVWAGRRSVRSVRMSVLLVTCVSAAVNGYITYTPSLGAVCLDYIRAGKAVERYENNWRSRAAQRIQDPAFYRVEGFDVNHLMDNCAEFTDFNGTSEYNSILNTSWIDAMKLENNKDMNGITTVHGMDARPVLMNLAHARYFVTRENGFGAVPFGYEEDASLSTGETKVYVCANPLSFGFSYDTFISRESFEKLSPLEKEMVQLYAAVPEERNDTGSDPEKALRDAGLHELASLPFRILEEEAGILGLQDADYSEGKLNVRKKWGSIEISAGQKKGYDRYLLLEHLLTDRATATVKVETGSMSSMVRLRSKDELYTLGREDYLIHLGYGRENQEDRVRISFWNKNSFQLSGIRLLYVPMQDFDRAINRLNEDSFRPESILDGEIQGTITLPAPKLVVFSVPWAKGWMLEVDGEQVPLQKSDLMYLSALMEEGTHTVHLKYKAPGAAAGAAAALGAIGIWIVFALYLRKRGGSKRE